MELKVWVEGVARVVCGLSLDTSCQDVVIALAQAMGQTGRYVLIMRLRATERQLAAGDCPLHYLAQLGQLATEVQFILRRTGPSLSNGQKGSSTRKLHPLLRHPEPEPFKRRGPQKALTFNLGPSTVPRRTKAKRTWSPSPRASPEPRASPVPFMDPPNPVNVPSSFPAKEDVFRQVLQQQARLQDLEAQLQALESELEFSEWERSSTPVVPGLQDELEELELKLRRNEAELMHGQYWEEELKAEVEKEQDIHRHLDQICSSIDDHNYKLQELQAHSAHLGQNLKLEAQQQSSRPATPQPEEALGPLKEQLHSRLQQGAEMESMLTQTGEDLHSAEAWLQVSIQAIEELNKELRQCNLQQFIQQTGVPLPPVNTELHLQENTPVTDHQYLCNAGILEDDQPGSVSAMC